MKMLKLNGERLLINVLSQWLYTCGFLWRAKMADMKKADSFLVVTQLGLP